MDWKKEIKLSDLVKREKKEKGAAAGAAERKTSFLKKEISLGRRSEARRKAEPEPKPKDDRVPFWKREVTIGRRKAAVPAPVEPQEAVAAAPEPEPRPQLEPELELAPPFEPEPVAASPFEPDTVVAAPAASDPGPAEAGYGWLTERIGPAEEDGPSWVDLVAGVAAEADVVDAPPIEPELEPAVPEAVAPPIDEPDLEPVAPPSVAPPEPVAATAAVPVPSPLPGIHPPVPASELPPLAGETSSAAAEAKSVLKREISFRRKPRPEKQPKAARKPKGDAVPFWRRELSLGRKPKTPAPEAAAPPPAAEPKPPFWKRDLSRKKKQAVAAAPVAASTTTLAERAGPAPQKAKRTKGGQRHKNLVGLKIGASQVAAARVANNGSAQLMQVARRPIEPGIVVGGELRDPDALAEVLRVFFKQHKLPKRGVRLGIATNRIGVRSFELEAVGDAKQLENAIRFRAQEALPIPIEEAVLDYQLLGETTNDEGVKLRRVLLVVAYRELVDRYVDACRKAGIRLVGIDLEAFALLRALDAPRDADAPPADAATVAVAIGYDRSTFAVSDGRVCEFTRVLEWGGFAINVAIARALDVAPSEAEPYKRQLTLTGAEVPEGLTAEQAEAARDAMRRQVGSFARELVSSLQFYQSQPSSLGIAGITITGGTAHLAGLGDEIERLIGVPVRIGDPLARVRVGRKVQSDDQLGSLAVAIGLGIDD